MTRIFLIVGWLLVCLDLIVAATLLFSSDSGDAATRGVAPGLGAALLVVGLIAAALLFWGGHGVGRPLVLVVGGLLVAIPVALTVGFIFSPHWFVGLMYPSMRRRTLPNREYAYPDAAGREAAQALILNDFAKFDSLLRATRPPDLTAHDELGETLLGLATDVATSGSAGVEKIEGLRLIIAAGARPQANDVSQGQRGLLELAADSPTVIEMLLNAGLSPEAPGHDGNTVSFFPRLTPDAARLLLARGAKRDARYVREGMEDWSPVAYQADKSNWATALALLEGGVPRDYGTPVGSVLQGVTQEIDSRLSDSERADTTYQAFMAAIR